MIDWTGPHAAKPNAHHNEDHKTRHQSGGADEIDLTGLNGASQTVVSTYVGDGVAAGQTIDTGLTTLMGIICMSNGAGTLQIKIPDLENVSTSHGWANNTAPTVYTNKFGAEFIGGTFKIKDTGGTGLNEISHPYAFIAWGI